MVTKRVPARTKEFIAWQNMKWRCRYKANWAGRGITICEKWRRSFAAFLRDVGLAPSKKHWLDRIDNDAHYEPSNVRWTTPRESRVNQRITLVTWQGQTRTIDEWAQITGIKRNTLRGRLHRYTIDRAMMVAHGNSGKGRTLTAEQAREIRRRWLAGEHATTLGREFGVHRTACSMIGRGKMWRQA